MTGPGAPTPPASIEVFYSYAHEDEELVKQLRKHLSILKRQGVIREWYDREITAGTDWKEGQLDQHLNSAEVILLLVSADFLASDYCYDVEMTRALERHYQGEARVIPVLLRKVDGWQGAPFGKIQSLPTDGKPVTSWNDRDEAFADVARGIRNAIGQLGVLQPPVGTTTVGQAFWNVPHPRNPSFTGREAEIAGLRERLTRTGKTALAHAISGLGALARRRPQDRSSFEPATHRACGFGPAPGSGRIHGRVAPPKPGRLQWIPKRTREASLGLMSSDTRDGP